MTLTQQFLLVSALPLSFLGMAAYLWRARTKRRPVVARWSFTLIAAAVWASSVIRFFGGAAFSEAMVHTWGIVGSYALSLTAVGLLLTTVAYLAPPRGYGQVALGLSLALWAGAIATDPAIWPYRLPELTLVGQVVRHFDVWAAIWIAGWLLPVVAAWLLTQQLNAGLPHSLYRNQVHYWLLVLSLFFTGNLLGSVQQPGQPGWQQAGVIVILAAALTGTVTFTRSTLPDLQLALRHVLSRLSGSLIIFGLTWGALSLIVANVTGLSSATPAGSRSLILLVAAALFAGFFTFVYRFVNDLTRRIFLPTLARRETVMADYSNAIGNLPDPEQLAQLFLRLIQANLATDDAWFFVADDGPAGKLVLRPLTGLDGHLRESIDFAEHSPIARRLRQKAEPLISYDIETLDAFADVTEAERATFNRWQRVLYQPLHAGQSLVGVLALGLKYSGETYDQQDLDLLATLSRQISPLLAQAENLASLRQINDFVFQQNQALGREKQHLQELVQLYTQFLQLISPNLRRPFAAMNKEIQQFQTKASQPEQQQFVSHLNQHIAELKSPIDNLITMSARIQMRSRFNFQPVRLDEIAQTAIRNLRTMAEARRVKVEFSVVTAQLAALGDEEQLLEAVQHLLHNAIKFNKIGGVVQVECGVEGSYLTLRVVDTGVGIPGERLETVWSGLNGSGANGHGGSSFSSGTGLGLVLTRFIVHAHGGTVAAESKYGSGSVFTLRLPLIFDE